jgi:hypothetical protein
VLRGELFSKDVRSVENGFRAKLATFDFVASRGKANVWNKKRFVFIVSVLSADT